MEDKKVYELLTAVYKALANPTRLAIIDLIGEGEKTVSCIAKSLGLSKSNVSQHLNYMKAVGLLCSRKSGKNTFYYLSDKEIARVTKIMKELTLRRFARCGQIISEEELEHLVRIE